MSIVASYMRLSVVDDPTDRPEWLRETMRLVAERLEDSRASLLARVEAASDAELTSGSDEDWGIGQTAVHLLVVERGVIDIALRLARGQPAGPTGQPRPVASVVTRDGIRSLAEKARAAVSRALDRFPTEPNTNATAQHPYYGPLNTFGWLLTLPNHYAAHFRAQETGTKSAL
jgi:hypothetical protein